MPTVFFMMALLVSCGTGGLDGTYVAKNDAAKNSLIFKFVFNDNKESSGEINVNGDPFSIKGKMNTVKIYPMDMFGMAMPIAIELTYSLKGDKLIIEGGIPGVDGASIELIYDKDKDELSLVVFGGEPSEFDPTWGKEGTFDPNNPYPKKDEEKITPAEPVKDKEKPATEKKKKDYNAEQTSNTKNKGDSWTYNPNVFYQELAETCAVYSEKVYNAGDIQQQLKDDGYTGFEYSFNVDEDGVGFALAHKKVNDNETLLAVVIRGTDGNEWFGNMDIGKNSVRHESFQQANVELQQIINDYISNPEYKLDNINFLVTGHSRGGAVANLLAVDLNNMTFIKNAKTKNVYAYTFATPNNRTDFNDKEYNNIFNFCFVDDFVTGVPLEKWGYGKSGKTYVAVAEGLSNVNKGFMNYAKSNNLEFNLAATASVIRDVYELTNSVERYYNKKLAMEPLHGLTGHLYNFFLQKKIPFLPKADPEEDKTLHEFMRDYISNAKIYGFGDISTTIGTALKQCPIGNDVHNIAIYFVDGAKPRKSVGDTHEMNTYLNALKANGFLTE